MVRRMVLLLPIKMTRLTNFCCIETMPFFLPEMHCHFCFVLSYDISQFSGAYLGPPGANSSELLRVVIVN
jgi:hypothetical protein